MTPATMSVFPSALAVVKTTTTGVGETVIGTSAAPVDEKRAVEDVLCEPLDDDGCSGDADDDGTDNAVDEGRGEALQNGGAENAGSGQSHPILV
jgi:hypothetical protein